MQKFTPCIWFDSRAEEAAQFYCSVFENARITNVTHYPESGQEITGKKPGEVLVVTLDLDGTTYTLLNGGPQFPLTEVISIQYFCKDQAETDRVWAALTADGGEEGPCGWLKDKFGMSWQVVPEEMEALIADPSTSKKSEAAMMAMMDMKKIDVAKIRAAYDKAED
jgi:predicted 3-demethylubiquinone-9 3-methyltransferase (glyoxalase superfamily)